MGVFKATLWLSAGKYGWSESFYAAGETQAEIMGRLKRLAAFRFALLGQGADLDRLEVQDVGGYGGKLAAGASGRAMSQVSGVPYSGVLVDVVAGGNTGVGTIHRHYLIRAVPESPDRVPRLNAYLKELSSGDWRLRGYDKRVPSYRIRDVVFLVGEDADILGHPLPDFNFESGLVYAGLLLFGANSIPATDATTNAPSVVGVRGVKLTSAVQTKRIGINGEHTIEGSAPGVVWIKTLYPIGAKYLKGGFVQVKQERFPTISDARIKGNAEQKCGRIHHDKLRDDEQAIDGDTVPLGLLGPLKLNPNGWNPGPVAKTLLSAQDLVRLIFEGYDKDSEGHYWPIGIAPIVNKPNTWLLVLSGVNNSGDTSANWWNAILGGLGVDNAYLDHTIAAIHQTIPVGDSIVFAGHSLGGMEGQLLACRPVETDKRPVLKVITFGSPFCAPQVRGTEYLRFAEEGDVVVPLSVFQIATFQGISQGQIECRPSDESLSTFLRHNDYPGSPTLRRFGPDGYEMSGREGVRYELGEVRRFQAP